MDTNNHCTSCGWCADNCPTKNIEIIDSKPEFKDRCLICLRCVYGCPANALYPKKFKFLLVKGGYSLAKVEKRMEDKEILPLNKIRAGILFGGVKKYIKDIEV